MNIEERRTQIRKLAALDNVKADEYLSSLGQELISEIQKSNDNDCIIDRLTLLGEFGFKVPEQVMEVIRFVINSEPMSPKVISVGPPQIEGKTNRDVLIETVELLDRLRYILPDDVLPLCAQLSLHEEKDVREKALKVVSGYSGFDFRVLPQIGYLPQRKMTDFLLAWSIEDRICHLDFVEAASTEILSASVGGGEMTSMDTYTARFGQVNPTEYLQKIRDDIFNLVYELFKSTDDTKVKLRLIKIFDSVLRPPHNVEISDDLKKMMRKDADHLVDMYRAMVLEGNPTIISYIEKTLYWMNRRGEFTSEKSKELRQEILGDDSYKLFKLLAGDRFDIQEEGGWKEVGRKHSEQISEIIGSITETSLTEWSEKLNKVAEQRDFVEDWRLMNFEHFLIEFALSKPLLADLLFEEAFTRNLPIRHFIVGFLIGIRINNEFELWDKYVEKIIQSQNVEHTKSIVQSLSLPVGTDLTRAIRDKDIDIIETIVNMNGPFSFLTEISNPLLHYTLIETILCIHKRDPIKIESLLLLEIENNAQYLEASLRGVHIAILRDWIDLAKLQPKTIKFLAQKLVILGYLNWEMLELLLAIGKVAGSDIVFDVFLNRIHTDEELGKVKKFADKKYEAIPYQWNPQLQEFISKDKDYQRIMSQWIDSMTPEWSIYNWHISRFMQGIGIGFSDILMSLIEKGDDVSVKRAAIAMHSMEGSNISLSIEIARRTDNKDILRRVAVNMFATGVVSGEYGIALAFENKAKELEKFKDDPSKRVRQFVGQMIQNLQEDAKRERERADEEKQLRRIEFEG